LLGVIAIGVPSAKYLSLTRFQGLLAVSPRRDVPAGQ
jgi:hypothetical protein